MKYASDIHLPIFYFSLEKMEHRRSSWRNNCNFNLQIPTLNNAWPCCGTPWLHTKSPDLHPEAVHVTLQQSMSVIRSRGEVMTWSSYEKKNEESNGSKGQAQMLFPLSMVPHGRRLQVALRRRKQNKAMHRHLSSKQV